MEKLGFKFTDIKILLISHAHWDHNAASDSNYFDLEPKYARMKESVLTAFVDPEGYKKYLAEKEEAFKTELAKQKASLPK